MNMRTRILFDLIARLSLVHVYLSFALYIHPYLYPTPTQKALELIKFYRFSVQSLSCVWLFVTPWTAACQASLSITNSRSLLKFMSIKSVMPSNHLILCHPLLFLPSVFLSIRWLKYWSFRFSISPSNEYSGLISFRIDWFDYKDHKGHWYVKINEVLKKETKALNVNKTLKLKLLLYLDSTGLVSSSWKSPRKKTSHPLLK